MQINGKVLNSFQANFLKELMGEPGMADVRAEAKLAKLASRYDVDLDAVLTAINSRFAVKNAEVKRLEAEELSR